MAGPSITEDKKLVYPVTSRDIDYRGMVIREWGVEWSKRDIVYEFSNARKFQDSFINGGPYSIPYVDLENQDLLTEIGSLLLTESFDEILT